MLDYWTRKLWEAEKSLRLLISPHERISFSEQQLLFKNNVELINLELSRSCNRRCDYCPVSFSDRRTHQDFMSPLMFDSIIQDLADVEYSNQISLNLYNEPLQNPNLRSSIELIRRNLRKSYISFNSNGDLIKEGTLQSLANAGLDHICITLHPSPSRDMTSQEVARRIHLILRKISYADTDNLNVDLLVETKEYFDIQHMGVLVRIQWPSWRKKGSSRGGQIEKLHKGATRTSPCVRPFREFTIYYDGTVAPCCEVFYDGSDKRDIISQLYSGDSTDIFSVYSGIRLRNFRRSVFDYSEKFGVCEKCPVADFSNGSDAADRERIMESTGARAVVEEDGQPPVLAPGSASSDH